MTGDMPALYALLGFILVGSVVAIEAKDLLSTVVSVSAAGAGRYVPLAAARRMLRRLRPRRVRCVTHRVYSKATKTLMRSAAERYAESAAVGAPALVAALSLEV